MHKFPMPAIVDQMRKAGCSAEQIGAVMIGLQVGPPKSKAAIRQARYRERKVQAGVTKSVTVTPAEHVTESVTVTPDVTPLARVEDNLLTKNLDSKVIYIDSETEIGDGFAEFSAAFPKRPDGAGSPRENRRAYDTALTDGGTSARLLAAAVAYAAQRATLAAKDPKQATFTLTAASWLDRGLWRSPLIALAAKSVDDSRVWIHREDPLWPYLRGGNAPTDGRGGWKFDPGEVAAATARLVAA
jgi:hypothetical protein